jgi:hypothetical protein
MGTAKKLLLAATLGLGLSNSADAQILPTTVYSPLARTVLPTVPFYGFAGYATWVGPGGGIYSAGYFEAYPIGGYRATSYYSRGNPSVESANALRKAQRTVRGTESTKTDSTAILQADFRIPTLPVAGESLRDGSALNDLLIAHLSMERSGERQAPGTISADQAKVLRFAGPAGDLHNWVRAGEIDFPPALLRPAYDAPRKWLKQDFKAIADQLLAGTIPEAKLLNALQTAGKAMKRTLDETKAKDSTAEIREVEQFLNRFDVAIAQARSATAKDLVNSDWLRYGMTVSALLDHMAKYKLTFAGCRPEAESEYRDIHATLTNSAKVVSELFK